jgi:hypothetical protein
MPRLPLVLAFVAILVAVLVEVGSLLFGTPRAPGLAVPALAIVDGLLAYTAFLLVSAIVLPQNWHSRARAITTVVLCIVLLIFAFLLILVAVAALVLMISLLLAFPFGPAIYLALFGSFESGKVLAALSVASFCRAAFVILLLVASWRYLKNKTLMLLAGTGFLGGFIVTFLFGFLPGLLHSIADAASAIVIGILAFVWALILLVRSLPALLQVLRLDRLA